MEEARDSLLEAIKAYGNECGWLERLCVLDAPRQDIIEAMEEREETFKIIELRLALLLGEIDLIDE